MFLCISWLNADKYQTYFDWLNVTNTNSSKFVIIAMKAKIECVFKLSLIN